MSTQTVNISRISADREKTISIYLKKDSYRVPKVIVELHNFTARDIGTTIYLFRMQRHSGKKRSKHWVHPENYNSTRTNVRKMGFGVIATLKIDGNVYWPSVPSWMPNNGFLQTEWTLTANDIANGYIEVYSNMDLSVFLRPDENPFDFDSSSLYIVGLMTSPAALKLTFGQVDGNEIICMSKNNLRISTNPNSNHLSDFVEDNELLRSGFYMSVE